MLGKQKEKSHSQKWAEADTRIGHPWSRRTNTPNPS